MLVLAFDVPPSAPSTQQEHEQQQDREQRPQRSSDDEEAATQTAPRPTLLWMAAQLAPSPEIVTGQGVARFGMRWQLTPLLWSFGVNRRVMPWRVLVVEPIVRQSGSIELYVSPEYVFYGSSFGDGWLFRVGTRSYFPLLERGDYLSISVGASFYDFAARSGVAYEAGVYTLYGIVGAQVTWSPTGGPAATIATLRLRYF